jgi:uncharacterized protein YhfF
MSIDGLPIAEFGFPGPLRDALVAAILTGEKTSTTGLRLEYDLTGETLPAVGNREVVIDSDGRPVAVIELTDIRVRPLADVDLAHALDEGEGFTTVAAWREMHEDFWRSDQMREHLGVPDVTTDDATPVVLQRFRLVETLE